VACAQRHKFEGDPGSASIMMSRAESYTSDKVAWSQREGVGATELNGGEARGGRR
jgi:hypothetical protein